MIHVVCLKWGGKYGSEYVNRLYSMVSRNLKQDFVFHCLTDNSQGIREEVAIEMLPELGIHSWWYKLLIFKNGFLKISSSEKILFLDLDIVILGDLEPLIEYKEEFCISADTSETRYNSSVMCFYANQYSFIWDSFFIQKNHIMAKLHGDQDWIEHVYQTANIYPKTVIKSFKNDLDCKTKYSFGKVGRWFRTRFPVLLPNGETAEPKGAAIVLFHGKPDPKDVMNGPYDKYRYAPWIKGAWKL